MAIINLKKGIRPRELPFYMNWPAIIDNNMKIVIQDEINQGDELELQGTVYKVIEVHEGRKAKGVCEPEDERPNFYDLTVKAVYTVRYIEVNNQAMREVTAIPGVADLPVQPDAVPTSSDEPF